MRNDIRLLVFLSITTALACGGVSGEPGDDGAGLVPLSTSNIANEPMDLQIVGFSGPDASLPPGSDYAFSVTLARVGCAQPVAGRQLFVHFVSPSRRDWFAFALFPVPAPPSETWPERLTISGSAWIPPEAAGTYEVMIGVNDGTSNRDSQNMRLLGSEQFPESYGDGAIGYRYRVASVEVSAGANPSPGTSAFPQKIIDDMTKPSDGVLLQAGSREANVQLGLRGRAEDAPTYWPVRDTYLSSGWWRGLTPWWNVLPVQGNSATHTRVEIGYGFTYVRLDDQWSLVSEGYNTWAGLYDYFASRSLGGVDTRPGSRSGHESFLLPDGAVSVHGGHPGARDIETWRVTGLVSCIEARLVVDPSAGVDDRHLANYIMWVGADWYPADSRWSSNPGWIPAVGASRRVKLTNDWQSICMAPLSDPGRKNEREWYTTDEAAATFSAASLIANPPPVPPSALGF